MLNHLVTGGAGFIGSHLVERLARRDSHVLVADSLLWGDQRIRPLVDGRRVLLEEGDIRDESFLTRVNSLGPFDTVFHLAALHYIPYCADHPVEALEVNVVGTQVLLQALKECPPRRFVFASTGDVYAPGDSPHREQDPAEPFSLYGITKLFGERLVAAAATAMTDTSFVVARLFNAYGPRETNPHLIPGIVDQLRRGRRVLIGNTWPVRDYVHVMDIAEALVSLARSSKTANFEVFNVGTGTGYSVAEVIETLAKVLSVEIEVESRQDRKRLVERARLVADATRLRRGTGWRPRVTLEDGLRRLCVHEELAARV